jgi:glycosyltransferase involved in cell wall biosynthesis
VNDDRRRGRALPPLTPAPSSDDTELLRLRAQVRELTAELHRSFQYLDAVRDHVDALFGSHRWRVGSRLVDLYLRLRRRRRPATAEDHLGVLFREIRQWEARRQARPFATVPSATSSAPPEASPAVAQLLPIDRQRSLFYRLVDEVLRVAENPAFARDFDTSEALLEGPMDGLAARATLPLVSVIMPTYERGHVVDEAIRSVLEQTYPAWELIVCDDGSTDGTEELVRQFEDRRLRYLWQENTGAAAARNRALQEARGELVAYLDSDNVWHPAYLATMVDHLARHAGHLCAYGRHVDVVMGDQGFQLRQVRTGTFSYEELAEKNFVDLNAFVHRRELYDALGGFDERLRRQQDWDLILKYAFLRDPLMVDAFLVLYRRNPDWGQITVLERNNDETRKLIQRSQQERHAQGLTIVCREPRPSVSILSWDVCRNHFSKAYNLAEAWSRDRDVELIGFRFFEDEIFPPYAGVVPPFRTRYFSGGDFPGFRHEMARALASIQGDVVYAVKPRLPSLGLALLANYQFGKPVVLEINDLESAVANPGAGPASPLLSLDDLATDDPRLLVPYDDIWSRVLEGAAAELPHVVTHNDNLDRQFGLRSFQVRNPKDESVYRPDPVIRRQMRQRLGFAEGDRVLLFGGMVRRHKGVFALVDFVEGLADERLRLLVVSSRPTPDEERLKEHAGDRVTLLPAMGRNEMAALNMACDATVLWLDPSVTASHFQMPFKLTDAMAMHLPVIANPVSDLAHLGQQGYLRLVDYGDFDGLRRTLDDLFTDGEATAQMTARARRLYLRQFSYAAVRADVELILRRVADDSRTLPVASRFAELFSAFYCGLAD